MAQHAQEDLEEMMSTAAFKFYHPVQLMEHPYRQQTEIVWINLNRGKQPKFHDDHLVAKGAFLGAFLQPQ
eukprot:9522211-Prorocentrum_lima.AAC.1